MAESTTTGTTSEDGGDAGASSTAGTPPEAGRDAEREPDYKTMYLESKNAVEERNRLAAEVEALKRAQPTPGAETPSPRRGTDWNLVRGLADQGDPVAQAQLDTAEMLMRQDVERQLDRISDPTLRARTEQHFNENRHRIADVKGALAEVRDADLTRENEDLRKALNAASKRPPEDTVRTAIREVGATEVKAKEMTRAEWNRDQATLSDTDRMRQQRAYRAGGIVVKD